MFLTLIFAPVNHYGSNYSQIRLYWLRTTPTNLAQSHGVRQNFLQQGVYRIGAEKAASTTF